MTRQRTGDEIKSLARIDLSCKCVHTALTMNVIKVLMNLSSIVLYQFTVY